MQKNKRMHDRIFISVEKKLSSSLLRHAYINFFERATLEEFSISKIEKDESVLHIGCGSLPNTLVSLGRNIQAHFVGIDRDSESVAIAKRTIDIYKLSNVSIQEGDAMSYPLDPFDVIIMSFGVEPKEAVFARIHRDMRYDTRLVFRKQWDVLDFLYGRDAYCPHGFSIEATHNRRDMLKSYLLKKV